jgi:outer membrane protein assembly factor BamB
MEPTMKMGSILLAVVLGVVGGTVPAAADDGLVEAVQSTGISGGLVVHLGCGDGKDTVSLRLSEAFLVHGLDADAQNVAKAREAIRSAGLYGPVAVDTWGGGALPYIDNCVNVLVVEPGAGASKAECMRVLCPGGVLIERVDGKWRAAVKPRPGDIDEWTHVLYDAGGNAVSKDRVVGPPRRLQWHGGPKWTRHHESMSSFQAMVSAKGRVFYIIDEAPQVSLFLPSDWQLIARDAFNGKILWKKKFSSWVTQLMNYKSGPTQSTRRLVAVGDRVFVTPGLDQGVHVLDAATGKTLRVLDKTAATEEILCRDGVLYLMTNDKPNLYPEQTRFGRNDWRGQTKWIRAVDPETGKHLWDVETPVAPLSFAVTERGVFFHDGKALRCLDLAEGKEKWGTTLLLDDVIPTSNTPTLVQVQDVVLFIGGKDHGNYRGTGGHYVSQNLRTFTALAADTGKILWTNKTINTGFECPKDILVLDGLVWIGDIHQGKNSGAFTGRDIHTGEVKREFKPPWDIYWFHQRCYRSKATERFIMPSRTGIEFISPTEGWTSFNHWVRGACLYGTMPANGLLYAPSHPCGCYMESLLHGFNALAPAAEGKQAAAAPGPRLEKGSAYGAALADAVKGDREWRTLRHDAARSGAVKATVPTELTSAWTTPVGENLTAPTVADGKVFLADKDTHTVHALDAESGKAVWNYVAGARVDSPPTIHRGRVLFGCRDGFVYCLDSRSGSLVWRYRAAPAQRLLVASEQIESVWPVHGSVLVVGDKLYCVAGRNMFLDGGMRMVCLDVATGRAVSETVLNDVDPTTDKSLQFKMKDRNLPTAGPDILSCDGKAIWMKSQKFTLDGRRPTVETTRSANEQLGPDAHLFAPAGFLDDTGFHRVCMLYGRTYTGGASSNHAAQKAAPAGKMLVFDDSRVYGFSRLPHLHRWVRALEFHIYAAERGRQKAAPPRKPKKGRGKAGKASKQPPAAVKPATPTVIHLEEDDPKLRARVAKSIAGSRVKYEWSSHDPDVYVNAMVLAGESLFAAGPPAIRNELTEEALARWRGAEGGRLKCLARKDGRSLQTHKLPAPPVFDGMAAAYGKLYLCLADGSVVCFSGGK